MLLKINEKKVGHFRVEKERQKEEDKDFQFRPQIARPEKKAVALCALDFSRHGSPDMVVTS